METIDDVVTRLDRVVEQTHRESSRIGFFAALYRRMTLRIQEAINAGAFDDGPWLERLDVAFAERYFVALDAYREGGPVTASWRVAFDSVERRAPLILQHLVLGINAHINLDLGIVTAELVAAADLPRVEGDFMRVNAVLERLLDEVQADINRLSPWFGIVDVVGGRVDERLFGFSLSRARDGAWRFASRLAELPPEARSEAIADMDQKIAWLGAAVARPPGLLRVAQWVARAAEEKDVARVIQGLR